MPRPIDADALKTVLDEVLSEYPRIEGGGFAIGGIRKGIAMALRAVCSAPTLDYAPVRHGEWVDEIEPNAVTASGMEVHVFRCSACDFTWANNVIRYFKYCPNCGAKMGAKEDAHG